MVVKMSSLSKEWQTIFHIISKEKGKYKISIVNCHNKIIISRMKHFLGPLLFTFPDFLKNVSIEISRDGGPMEN